MLKIITGHNPKKIWLQPEKLEVASRAKYKNNKNNNNNENNNLNLNLFYKKFL